MEIITDVDYRHAKKVFNIFNNKNLGEYYDFSDKEWYITTSRGIWKI